LIAMRRSGYAKKIAALSACFDAGFVENEEVQE